MIEASEAWREAYPGAVVGVLAMSGAANPERCGELERLKEEVEASLRRRFAAGDKKALRAEPIIAAYDAYYKRFGNTYHVTAQIESIVWKGRGIPSIGALVEAMFMAELSSMLLTAGHDRGKLSGAVRVDAATGSERYVTMKGEERAPKPGDMAISDGSGIISTILYGPDQRTSIGPETKDVLFTVYAPPGIGGERVKSHLEEIARLVRVIAPESAVDAIETVGD